METLVPITRNPIEENGRFLNLIMHPQNNDHYLATFEIKQSNAGFDIPETEHEVILYHLDENMIIIEEHKLINNINKTDSNEFGIKHCILLNDTLMLGTNVSWNEEMYLFHLEKEKIVKAIPLNLSQNVFILLHHKMTKLFGIYSYNPIQVLSIDVDTGNTQIVNMQRVLDIKDSVVTSGRSVYVEKKKVYLLNVRLESTVTNEYMYSLWMTFTPRFKLEKMSKPFLFHNKNSNRSHGLHNWKPSSEFCTGLILKNETVTACVTIGNESFVNTYDVNNILRITKF